MTTLTDDEYSCLMIMAQGQNLIAMRDTRWYAPLMSLHAKDYCKGIGNNNYIITQRGHEQTLDGHEQTLNGELRQMITKHGQIQESRQAVHSKMQVARNALVEGARMAALTTGKSETACLRDMVNEVSLRAQEMLK